MKNIQFNLTFGGFYYSFEDSFIDRELELICEDKNIDFDELEYTINYDNISKEICENVFYEFIERVYDVQIQLKYLGLSRPKYYNFETDSIYSDISFNDLKTLLKAVYKTDGRENVLKWINEASSSRDGFISFYDGLNEVKKDIKIFINYLFQYIYMSENMEDYIQSLDYCNFYETVANNIEVVSHV